MADDGEADVAAAAEDEDPDATLLEPPVAPAAPAADVAVALRHDLSPPAWIEFGAE